MRELHIVGRRLRVTKKIVGGLDVVAVDEHFGNAFIRVSSHCRSNGHSTLISPGFAQINLGEMLLRPRERGFLMNCSNVQGRCALSFHFRSQIQRQFRAKVWVMTRFEQADNFSEGLAVVQVRGSWGFIDKTGRLVIEPKYEWCCGFSEGVAVVMKTNEVLLIDESGQTILSRSMDDLQLNIYEDARLSEGLIDAYDCTKSKTGFIDKTGNFVIEPKFDNAGPFSEGLARVTVTEGGEEKFGFIDHSGQFVIPPIFNTDADFRRNSTDFSEDWASVTENLRPTITEEEKFVYIDKKGAIALFTDFFYAGPFREGLACPFGSQPCYGCASPKLDSPVFSTTSHLILPLTIFQIKIRT
jgi:hypothetical protein